MLYHKEQVSDSCPSLSHFQYVTVTTGCARKGCMGMEAVSVMRAGRVSAVTRVSGFQRAGGQG